MAVEACAESSAEARDRLRALLARRAEQPAATLVLLRGEAEAFEPETGRWHEAREGAVLSAGQRLRALSGRALLRLSDGSDVWLAPGAEVDLSAWGAGARALRLAAGRLFALVAAAVARPFTVATPSGTIVVTGTAFEADAAGASLEVAVFHGSVRVAAGGREARASRGRRIVASASGSVAAVPFACDAARLAWIGGAEPSLSNPKIASAAGALAATLQHGLDPRKDASMKARKIVLGITATTAALAFLWFGAAQTGVLAALGGGDKPKISLTYVDKNGREYRADGNDAAALAAMRAAMTENSRKSLDEALARQRRDEELARKYLGPAAANIGGMDMRISELNEDPPELRALIDRETASATEAYRQMLDRGIPPEKAKEAVAAAFADSLRAQQKAWHPGANTAVHVEAEIVDDNGKPRVRFEMTTRQWEPEKRPAGMPQEEFDRLQRENGPQDGITVPKSGAK